MRVTTTTAARLPELTAQGLNAQAFSLEADTPRAAFLEAIGTSTALIVTLPPGLRADPVAGAALYTARLVRLAALLTGTAVRHALLLSSTAVYADAAHAPVLMEDDADPTNPLFLAESAFAAALPEEIRLTIVRLAGLMGSGRAPGRFFAGGRAVPQPEAPVNMVHQVDAVGAIEALLKVEVNRLIVNVCAADHSSRRAFYTAAAAALQLPPPAFAPPDEAAGKRGYGKQVSSALLRETTGYEFTYDHLTLALLHC